MKCSPWLCLVCAGFAIPALAGERPVTHIRQEQPIQRQTQRELLIGDWKGEATVASGGSRSWITRRREDGTFRVDFTIVNAAGVVSTQSEAGIWGTSSGIYFTATRTFIDGQQETEADTRDPSLYDVYKIIQLDRNTFEYENPSTGNRFIMRRLPKASR